ncbi:MAG TPA: hypothetical protein VKS79_11000 [Gemmataceae bacterium]|nr:hypothetical protein [Gemmataceae bacterium]
MASKSTRLMFDALARAVAEPAGLPLFNVKSASGLFPPSAAARQIAQRCKDEGLLRVLALETGGKQPREICAITDKGREWLLSQASPRQVLEDFVRVLEDRQKQIAELQTATRNLAASVESLQSTVQQILPATIEAHHNGPNTSLACTATSAAGWTIEVSPMLEQWHANNAGDCPLPELYRNIKGARSDLSIGNFHDGLRLLHEQHQVYLHPWTGPLYQLPEPPYALLIGHFVAYYASLRNKESDLEATAAYTASAAESFRNPQSAIRI